MTLKSGGDIYVFVKKKKILISSSSSCCCTTTTTTNYNNTNNNNTDTCGYVTSSQQAHNVEITPIQRLFNIEMLSQW